MSGSSARLRRLGAELRRLREATGRTQSDVGAAIDRTHTTLVNWERGKTRISKSDLVCLLTELRAPAEVRKGLEQLHEESKRNGTSEWAVYALPEWLRPLVSFEEDATVITTFEPTLVPGLLQTEDYARAIHTTGRRKVAAEYVEKWVAARMERQHRISSPEPTPLHAVISEAVLRLEVGGPEVFTGQVEHLLKAAHEDNVTVQVLPATKDGYAGVATNFAVLHFADALIDPPLGYFDGPLGGYMVSDEGDVATLINMFDDARKTALSEADSVEMLSAVLDEHRRKDRRHA